jgi:hypothetical protein
MEHIFSFDWQTRDRKFVRIVFLGASIPPAGVIANEIKVSVQRTLFPDIVLFLIPEFSYDALRNLINCEEVNLEKRRFSSRTSILLAKYDNRGEINLIENDQKTQLNPHMEFDIESIKTQGAALIFDAPGVVVPAPAGYVFIKPSNEFASHFILAEDALVDSGRVEFIAFCMLRKISKIPSLERIYVDSMGIGSIAYALRELLGRFRQVCPQIISFNSYHGFSRISIPNPGTSFCIISASASMNLFRDWIVKTNCALNEVVALVTFSDALDFEHAVFAGRKPNNWSNDRENKANKRVIKILGERFQPESIPIKRVLLTKKYPPIGVEEFEFEKRTTGVSIHYLRSQNSDRFPLFIDCSNRFTSGLGMAKIERLLASALPASVQAIVHLDDQESCDLAKFALKRLISFGSNSKVKTISSADVSGLDYRFDCNRAVLIIASSIGKGSKLLSLARSLRDKHIGFKSFLIFSQVASSNAELVLLKSNLQQNRDGQNVVHVIHEFAVGTGLADFVSKEITIRKNSNFFHQSNLSNFDYSGSGYGHSPFLPNILGKTLKLRADFVFWKQGYKTSDSNETLVLLTIGCLLQRLREDMSIPEMKRLSTEVLQQVVLDPKSFERFNDGIIQASILRQATDAELDYTGDKDSSRFVSSMLIGFIDNRHVPQGEAVMEFALAIAVGRLKLEKTVAAEALDKIRARRDDLDPSSSCFALEQLMFNLFDHGFTKLDIGITGRNRGNSSSTTAF